MRPQSHLMPEPGFLKNRSRAGHDLALTKARTYYISWGTPISPNPRLPSLRKHGDPIFPNCFFLLRLLSLQHPRTQLLGGLQSPRFLQFFKWPFLTFKCQNFGKSHKINFKDEIIVDINPEVYTFKSIYIGVRL